MGNFKWNLLNFIMYFPTMVSCVGKVDARFMCVMKYKRNPMYTKWLMETIWLTGVTVCLFYNDWLRALLVWDLPHRVGQFGIITMNLLQHDGCDVSDESYNKTNYDCARNFLGPVINLVIFNNGYHTIHHLYPQLHWYDLPKEHEKQVKPKINPALDEPCMRSYFYRAYINPGIRVHYKTKEPLVVDAGEDKDWVEPFYPKGMTAKDFQPTAAMVLRYLSLLPIKLISPMWSPTMMA